MHGAVMAVRHAPWIYLLVPYPLSPAERTALHTGSALLMQASSALLHCHLLTSTGESGARLRELLGTRAREAHDKTRPRFEATHLRHSDQDTERFGGNNARVEHVTCSHEARLRRDVTSKTREETPCLAHHSTTEEQIRHKQWVDRRAARS